MPETDNLVHLDDVLHLATGAQLKYDAVRNLDFLLLPERVVKLNKSAASILYLIDGKRTVREIALTLSRDLETFDNKSIENDVLEFLSDCKNRGWLRR
jgi:pyrroloquinoline quinone biosynthesis protein D